jgi:6,7-dimethyl-8-ribityllumazine synthase
MAFKTTLTKRSKFLTVMLFFAVASVWGQSISTPTVTPSPVCSGSSVTINFDVTNGNGAPRRFTTGTEFTVYLSNSAGASYTVAATFFATTTTFGTNNNDVTAISFVLPILAGTPTGSGYRVRINSASPTEVSSVSAPFTINAGAVSGSISGATTVCAGTNSTVLTLNGQSGSIQWQSSSDNVTFGNISGATSSTYTATNLTATTYYRAVLTSGTCTATTASVMMTVSPTSVAGSIGGATTVCSGTNSTLLTLTGNTGTIQWQSSSDNITFNNISGATASTYTAANLTATTYYRAVVTSGVCSSATTSSVTMTVSPASVAGSIGGAATVCSGTNSTLLTLSGNTGTIQWQSSSDDIAFNNIPGATSTTYTATNLIATTYYRAVVTSGACASATTASVAVTTSPVSVAGSISGASTVCSGTNSTLLTLSGNTGTIQWQSSSDNITFADISGATSTTYTAANLTATTYYQAVVTSSVCAPATTASVAVTVNPVSVAGSISGATAVCSGTNSTLLTLSGNTGTIQWQSSSDNITFADISGATSTTYTATNLTATTYYQAVVTSGVCAPATTASVAVTVDPVSVAGSISGSATVCSGTNSTELTLSGYVGSIQWQSSTDDITFADISGATSSTYTATDIAATTYYRAVVTSGACSSATTFGSTEITVNPVSVAGSISGATTVCGGTNSTVLTLSGQTGSIQWQSSTDNITFSDIVGATGTTYTATNLTATTYYQAVVTSGVCAPSTTASVEMTVSSLNAGVIADAENAVCTGTNSTLLTVTGATGTIQWQSSADDLTFADISGENGTTYTATNLTATTFYRVVVSGGVCPPVQSASVVIDVFGPSVSGTISGEGTVCEGSPAELTLTGNTGTIQWQSSSDDITFTNISGATSANYSIPSVTGTTYYRVVVMNGACSSATSASVMVASGGSTTWDGSAWSNGAPTSTVTAYISGNYNESVDINACNLFVDNNAVVVIPTGFDVSLNGALIVTSGSFTLENAANLLQSNNVANSGNIIVKRNSSSIRRQDYTLWSSPVAGQSLLAFSPFTVTSPTSRFYQYNSSTNLYNSISSPGSVNFNDAQGYLIRVANNHPAFPWIWNGQFTGVPHNGDYSYTMFNGGAGFRYNLVGNPYPSPVSMTAFIAANSSQITGTLYFWRETNGNPNNNPYCTWSPAAGGTFVTNGEASVVDPQGIIETGQGFFVEASATGSAVSFTNAMRVGNNANQFFRPATIASNVASDPSRLWLNITNTGGAFCQTAIVYTDDATNGFDLGIDGRLIGQAATQLYSIVDTEKLSIQARAPFMPSDIVPIAFKATTAGEYSIAIDHVDGLFTAGQAIYIKDNLTVTQHLLNDGPYQFTTDAGEFTSRFEIVYEAALGTVNPTLDNTVRIIKNNGAFTINSGNATINNVQVFDIRGRLLTQLNDEDATQTSFTVNGTNQVLIVKIKSVDGQLVTRKVMN